MQDGLQQALAVPEALAERISALWPHLKEMVVHGNISCKSDAQVRMMLQAWFMKLRLLLQRALQTFLLKFESGFQTD